MPTRLYPAAAVLSGHPDKRCDAIADALVAAASRRDSRARCAVVAAVHGSTIFVAGQVACDGAESIDVEEVVRSVHVSAGFTGEWQPAAAELKIVLDLYRSPAPAGAAAAGGQCIVTGYAVDLPGTNQLPPEQWLAARLRAAWSSCGPGRRPCAWDRRAP